MGASQTKARHGVCALCQQIAQLRRSHILPEFFFRRVYDPTQKNRKYEILSTDPNVPERFQQKGYRETLLCDKCEQHISRWESYASDIFYGVGTYPIERSKLAWRFGEVDYRKFKLFLLSLLWRMHASAGDFFSKVDLGEHHSERIRQALLRDDPFPPEDYFCFITAVRISGELYEDWILQPDFVRSDGYRYYRLVICGYLFCFVVSARSLPEDQRILGITGDDKLTIMVQEIEKIPYLAQCASRIGAAIRKRSKDG